MGMRLTTFAKNPFYCAIRGCGKLPIAIANSQFFFLVYNIPVEFYGYLNYLWFEIHNSMSDTR